MTAAASWTPGGNVTAARGSSWFSRNRAISRSEEHTSELQSHLNLVCRLLLEKKKKYTSHRNTGSSSYYVNTCTVNNEPPMSDAFLATQYKRSQARQYDPSRNCRPIRSTYTAH